LKNQITENISGTDTFRVINLEASIGKSVESNRIIKEYLETFEFTGINFRKPHRKFLIVKRFTKDVEAAESVIGDSLNSEWQQKVIGITGENWMGGWQIKPDKLIEADVLIITHARYIMLCSSEEERNVFIEGRHTLIIDERIDFSKYPFSRKKNEEIYSILPPSLGRNLVDVCQPLFNEINKIRELTDSEGKKLYAKEIMKAHKPSPKQQFLVNQFKSIIGSKENLKEIEFEKGKQKADIVREFLNALGVIYSDDSYFNNGTITGYNRNHKLWGLENNIILDANGSIERLYKSDERWKTKFILDNQSKIINHSKSTITHIKLNTSKTKIQKYDDEPENDYFNRIIAMIMDEYKIGQKVLIVLHKKFIFENNREGSFVRYLRKHHIQDIFIGCEDESKGIKYNNERFAVNWFGNLIGKNDWKDFDQCWVLGTPNIPMETHVINLAQYSGKFDWRMGLEMIRKSTDKYIFKNKVYENIRVNYLVGELYQTIKRIQRNPRPAAQFYLVNNDEQIFSGVVKMVDKVQVLDSIQLKIKKKEKEESTEETVETEESKLKKRILMQVIHKPKGDYSKKIICAEVGIDASHLNRYFNKKMASVKAFIDTGEITIGHHKITRH
jgi:hypothetical protein